MVEGTRGAGTFSPSVNVGNPREGLRSVDGILVPPFGCALDTEEGEGFSWSEGFLRSHLAAWPERSETPNAVVPLSDASWTSGPYKNASGKRWSDRINAWHLEGSAAGLIQDTFRSFDNGHSSIRRSAYPQIRAEDAVSAFGVPWESIFRPRVTMGVQSYGSGGMAVIERQSRQVIRSFYDPRAKRTPFQQFYKLFYENNFFFVAPAVGSFSEEDDKFAFLSPFYLHSIGASGTDARLLKPLVLASAALPPKLKTRMLKQGLFVPTLMYLFKSNIAGDIKSPRAHVPAYALPAEASDDFEGPTPFLDGLLSTAHSLTHIPPVCRMRVKSLSVEGQEFGQSGREAYHEDNTYAFAGALRPDQELVLTVDLRYSS